MSCDTFERHEPLPVETPIGPWPDEQLSHLLPVPAPDAHKYSRGVLALLAGSERYPGAAVLAARASQRMGAGYTEVFTAERAVPLLLAAAPSLVVHGDALPGEGAAGALRTARKGQKRAVCAGPGFDADDSGSLDAVVGVLEEAQCAVLVDGGGLAALSTGRGKLALDHRRQMQRATVVTPHAGEARKLADAFGVSADQPAALASRLAAATGAVVVLKGSDTFIADGEVTYAMREGTAALAKAGTGDVLAGMVAALLAQGLAPFDAAVLGTTLHARAGIAAAQAYTQIGVTPEDVVDAIPAAIRALREDA